MNQIKINIKNVMKKIEIKYQKKIKNVMIKLKINLKKKWNAIYVIKL